MASTNDSLTKILMDLGQSDVHVDSAPAKRSSMKTLEQLKASLASKEITQEEYDAECKKLDDSGGSTEMSTECTARGDGVGIEMKSVVDAKPVWIQVARPGKFKGHAAGHFEMNATVFSQIIANFNAQENKLIPVDFEHASEQAPTQGSIPHSGAPAQGWITQLEMRADGNLWGLVAWGDLARQYIKKGQYKFLSPAIVFGAKDRVSGKSCGARLSSVALTNNPFLDGMQQVAAKRSDAADAVITTAFEAVREALELPKYMDAAHVLVSINMTAGGATGQQDADARALKVRDALRLPLTASNEEVFNAARIACGAISPPTTPSSAVTETKPVTAKEGMNMSIDDKKDTEVAALTLKLGAAEAAKVTLTNEHAVAMKAVTDENVALKAKVAEYEEKEISTLVDGAMNVWGEKKGLTADSRPHLMRMAKNDREGFVALFPPPVKGSAAQPHHGKLVAAGNHQVAPTTTPTEGGQVFDLHAATKDVASVEDLAAKFIVDAKALGTMMSREEAFSRAHTERSKLVTAAAQKSFVGNGG